MNPLEIIFVKHYGASRYARTIMRAPPTRAAGYEAVRVFERNGLAFAETCKAIAKSFLPGEDTEGFSQRMGIAAHWVRYVWACAKVAELRDSPLLEIHRRELETA